MREKAIIVTGYMSDDFLFSIKPLLEKAGIETIDEFVLNAVNTELVAEGGDQINPQDFEMKQQNCVTLLKGQKIFFTEFTFIFSDQAVDCLGDIDFSNNKNVAHWLDVCINNYTLLLAEPARPSIESPVLQKLFGKIIS